MSDSRRVFVAEDNGLVMMSIEGLIEDMEWELVGPARTLDEALEMARTCEVDVALLDVNLAEQASYPAGERLRARGVPVMFATGYAEATKLPASLADAPLLAKPYSLDDMEQLLRKLAG
ncbi:response regulator [Pacificimonas sp. WHA3]|uniref:Response regulator n=1 Tax=Pacificimonas pallii TaxID=2827236 RepID=A0ABS6SF81_9SPHN|nr:response regulator [Pacificimonas pallii]MBV7256517.1 response regulator [Pacificimonas pallii]